MANPEMAYYPKEEKGALKGLIETGMVLGDLAGIAFGIVTGDPIITTVAFAGLLGKLLIF